MNPRSRPFFPENIPDPVPEPTPVQEQVMTPEQEYIETQIRIQVQAQMQEYIQSQAQAQSQFQAQNQDIPHSQNPFQSVPASLTSRIKLPDAAKFDGKPFEYASFLNNMNLFFWASPEMFAADRSKILYVGTHLLGTASNWFGSLVSVNSPCLDSYETFLTEFANNFSDPSHSIKVRGLIRKCKQGPRTVISYATEFRALARESGFDDIALVDQFLRGLNPKIMQYLMLSDLPNSLEENIKIAIRVDNRITTVDQMTNTPIYEKSHNPFRKSNNNDLTPASSATLQSQDQTVYMEIDAMTTRPRGPLTAKEKARRYELGLCLYCGGSGHIALECTRRKTPGKVYTQQ
ncbi:Retrotransposon-derived protein PEG10 [Smittium culicis]|uniref:Retrotransposon-derived protein PEG10 n=1 Tax=Smittium culicis TaxID=133412 RepID=A0A1R1X8V9_9FUNG|nr:Retrotransposon-derived protein PEG10 [Smittium culicis]